MNNTSNSQEKSFTPFLFLLSVVLSILVLVWRKPEALTKAQFWAEDGVIFFQQSYQLGIHTIFVPYAGYLHLVPRTAALLDLYFVSYHYMPLAYNLSNLILFLGLVCFIWKRTTFDPYTKFFMTMALSLVPTGSEMVFCLTNVQWYTNLFIPLFYLAKYERKYAVFDGIVLLFVGLSGPFSLVFLPAVAALIWFRSRKWGQWKEQRWFFIISVVSALIQLGVLASSSDRPNGWTLSQKIAHSSHMIYLQLTTPLGIPKLYSDPIHHRLFALLAILLLGWIYLCWRTLRRRADPLPFFLMLAAIVDVAANLYSLDPSNEPYLNPLNYSMRYFFGPCVLFFWSVFVYFGSPGEDTARVDTRNRMRFQIRNLGFLLLYSYYTVVLVLTIPIWPMSDEHWPEQAKRIENLDKGHLEIPINPDFHWKIELDK